MRPVYKLCIATILVGVDLCLVTSSGKKNMIIWDTATFIIHATSKEKLLVLRSECVIKLLISESKHDLKMSRDMRFPTMWYVRPE